MQASDVNLASLQGGDCRTAAHQTRHQVVLARLPQIFGYEKHRRITAGYDDLPSHRLTILEKVNLDAFVSWPGPYDQTISGRRQSRQLTQSR
jgi:hypothetical protein